MCNFCCTFAADLKTTLKKIKIKAYEENFYSFCCRRIGS